MNNKIKTILTIAGLYYTVYASAYYQYNLDIQGLRTDVTNITTQVQNSNKALQLIAEIQNKKIRHKPTLNPLNIIQSFYDRYNQIDKNTVEALKRLLIQNKKNLTDLNLSSINLRNTNLNDSNLSYTNLSYANLNNTYLNNSNFR